MDGPYWLGFFLLDGGRCDRWCSSKWCHYWRFPIIPPPHSRRTEYVPGERKLRTAWITAVYAPRCSSMVVVVFCKTATGSRDMRYAVPRFNFSQCLFHMWLWRSETCTGCQIGNASSATETL
ncbi:hypothetical protein Ancab_013884 [Ancistrocladus abbreviatus]